MEEERFFRAAVEDEGVAPLEPGDEMSLARLFREQHGNRVLGGLALGRSTRRDPFRFGPRPSQHGLDRAVVDDDVGVGEEAHAPRGQKPGVSGARADDVDPSDRRSHRLSLGPK